MSVSNVTNMIAVPNLNVFAGISPDKIDINKIFRADPEKWTYNGHGYSNTAANGLITYVTQPGGVGEDIFITVTDPKLGLSVTWNAGDVNGTLTIKDVDVEGRGTLNGMNAKTLEEWITEMFLTTEHNGPGGKKRKANGQSSASQGNGAANGAGGVGGANMEGGVLDPAEWSSTGESWFVLMQWAKLSRIVHWI
jgi:hypothetical protein